MMTVADFITVYIKSVGLHVPETMPFTFTEFYTVSTALTNVPFVICIVPTSYFPSHDEMQIFLPVFLIDGTNLLPVTPLPTKRNNKQQQQTIKTNK